MKTIISRHHRERLFFLRHSQNGIDQVQTDCSKFNALLLQIIGEVEDQERLSAGSFIDFEWFEWWWASIDGKNDYQTLEFA
jgi:hypothetical protein